MADASGLRRAVQDRAERRFTGAVQVMVDAVREDAPRDSGVLKSSIGEAGRSTAGTRLSTQLVVPVEYASWQDEGTGIYGPKGTPIRAKDGGVLAWKVTGRRRRARVLAGWRWERWRWWSPGRRGRWRWGNRYTVSASGSGGAGARGQVVVVCS